MWHWVTSSRGERLARSWVLETLSGLALSVVFATPLPARVLLTVDEALELAFPGCRVERTTVYLTEEQLERARELAGGEVDRIEVLAFREPPDYLPRDAWYQQFAGRGLDPQLELKRGIRGVTGATLTARATTGAVRRVLALDRVIRDAGALDPETRCAAEAGRRRP